MKPSHIFKFSFFIFSGIFVVVLALYFKAQSILPEQTNKTVLGVSTISHITPEMIEENITGNTVLGEDGIVR